MKQTKLITGFALIIGLLATPYAHGKQAQEFILQQADDAIEMKASAPQAGPGIVMEVRKKCVDRRGNQVGASLSLCIIDDCSGSDGCSIADHNTCEDRGAARCEVSLVKGNTEIPSDVDEVMKAAPSNKEDSETTEINDADFNGRIVMNRDAVCTARNGQETRHMGKSCLDKPCAKDEKCGSRPSDWF